MEFHGYAAIGLLQVGLSDAFLDAKYFVIVAFFHFLPTSF
jgi:hypothetical protein